MPRSPALCLTWCGIPSSVIRDPRYGNVSTCSSSSFWMSMRYAMPSLAITLVLSTLMSRLYLRLTIGDPPTTVGLVLPSFGCAHRKAYRHTQRQACSSQYFALLPGTVGHWHRWLFDTLTSLTFHGIGLPETTSQRDWPRGLLISLSTRTPTSHIVENFALADS